VILTDRNPLFGTDSDPCLGQEFGKAYWANLEAFVAEERSRYDVYPPDDEVFAAFHLTRYAETRVVILGQDPYHGVGQAHGLAFSVRCGVSKPPSLKKILKELNQDLGIPTPDHGNLEAWARRGVLLLNTTLTVRAGAPGSHMGRGWETFTYEVIRCVDAKTDRVVFLLWGEKARRMCALIDTSRHTIICSSHPRSAKGFSGTRPFSHANSALVAAGLEAIDWTLGPC
jgi:uracil-DNA glycosylase